MSRAPRFSSRLALLAWIGMVSVGLASEPTAPPPSSAPKAKPRSYFGDGFGAGVAYSPNGRALAAGKGDGTVWLGRGDEGELGLGRSIGVADPQFSTYRMGPGPIRFSADGAILVAGNFLDGIDSRDHRRVGLDAIRAWDVASGRVVATAQLDGLGRTFAITPDGRTIRASVRKGRASEQVQSWDLATGRPLGAVGVAGPGVQQAAFSPDASLLAVARPGSPTVAIHEAATGRVLAELSDIAAKGEARPAVDVLFSPDGRTLGVVRAGNLVQLWDVGSKAVRASIAPPSDDAPTFPYQMAFSGDGRRLILLGAFPIRHRPGETAFDARAILIDAASGNREATIEGMSLARGDLALSPDGRRLAIAGIGFSGTIPVGPLSTWDLPPGR